MTLYEAKAAGAVRFAKLYHASVAAERRKAAAWATDEFDEYERMQAALKEVQKWRCNIFYLPG